jgi:hypothetical protein
VEILEPYTFLKKNYYDIRERKQNWNKPEFVITIEVYNHTNIYIDIRGFIVPLNSSYKQTK